MSIQSRDYVFKSLDTNKMYIEIGISFAAIISVAAFLLRNKIKKRAKAYVLKKVISEFVPAGLDKTMQIISSNPVTKEKGYWEIKDGKQSVFVRFDEDMMLRSMGMMILLSSPINGEDEDRIISLKPGFPFCLSPRDMGYSKMTIMKRGVIVQEVTGDMVPSFF